MSDPLALSGQFSVTGPFMQVVNVDRYGVVASFDEEVGLGELMDDQGLSIGFHCTQIVDGSRTIDEGARVIFSMRRANLGAIEATSIRLRP